MTQPVDIRIEPQDFETLASVEGAIAIIVSPDGKLDQAGRRLNTASRKALARFVESDAFASAAEGSVHALAYPVGLAAVAILVVKLSRTAERLATRKAGVALAKAHSGVALRIYAGNLKHADELALGLALRAYDFVPHKTSEPKTYGRVTLMVSKPETVAQAAADGMAVAEGVFFTRDLVNEPANVLTTDDFAARLAAMQDLGLDVEILEEEALNKLGMGALLCVGQGSASPSKVVIMKWNGGGDEAPFAFVGKGVVFDTGGISLKPAGGMEDMTMDMGGAGVVAGVMRTLALRKAKANVVGLVGLVENMPSGTATRPGDVVTSMKGDTIEVINTDAEGRLVLADVLWYTQDRFNPSGMVDLATLTGAMVVALGHENTGVFTNDNALSDRIVKAAGAEGEGAWPMPMGPAYDKLLASRIADMKNVGGRPAGSITAAQFLKRFVKDDVPWCHLDIAGTASTKSETAFAPKGASGWGVMALNRLISDHYED